MEVDGTIVWDDGREVPMLITFLLSVVWANRIPSGLRITPSPVNILIFCPVSMEMRKEVSQEMEYQKIQRKFHELNIFHLKMISKYKNVNK